MCRGSWMPGSMRSFNAPSVYKFVSKKSDDFFVVYHNFQIFMFILTVHLQKILTTFYLVICPFFVIFLKILRPPFGCPLVLHAHLHNLFLLISCIFKHLHTLFHKTGSLDAPRLDARGRRTPLCTPLAAQLLSWC